MADHLWTRIDRASNTERCARCLARRSESGLWRYTYSLLDGGRRSIIAPVCRDWPTLDFSRGITRALADTLSSHELDILRQLARRPGPVARADCERLVLGLAVEFAHETHSGTTRHRITQRGLDVLAHVEGRYAASQAR